MESKRPVLNSEPMSVEVLFMITTLSLKGDVEMIYTEEECYLTNKNGILSLLALGMALEHIDLTEMSRPEGDHHHTINHVGKVQHQAPGKREDSGYWR